MMKRSNKVFLSDVPEETGSICWRVDDTEDCCYAIEAEIKFYDCNRSVAIDFDCFEATELPARIAKVGVLITELTKFKEALKTTINTKAKFYY